MKLTSDSEQTTGSGRVQALGQKLIAISLFGVLALPAGASDQDDAFLAAREAFQKGRIEKLDSLAAGLADHPLFPYVAYWQLRSRLSDAPEAEVQSFLTEYGDSLAAQRLRADWLKQLGERREWTAFEREIQGVALDDPELVCYLLQARLARADLTALADVRTLWFQGVAQPDGCAPLFDRLVAGGQLTEEDVWARIRLALEAGSVTLAKSLGAHIDPAKRIPGKQIDAVTRNAQRYLERRPLPLKSRAERELAMFATWRVAQTLPAVAASRLEKFDASLSAEERAYAWGQVAMAGAQRHRPEALDWFKRAGEAGLGDKQLAWRARTGLRLADWPTVLSSIEAMSAGEQQHVVWRYWKARALIALGRSAEASALLGPLSQEHHFYGHLASEELGAGSTELPPLSEPGLEVVDEVERVPGIQRALRLYRLGLRYEGALEWRWTTRAWGDQDLLAAAEVARRAGWYERAIDTAERTQRVHNFTLRFPTPYREVVSNYTRQLDLDEAWVYGLVRQESRFVVDARSSAGAQGLMQLMPATARQVARRLGLPGPVRHHVTSVETNINLGTYYLRDLMDSLDEQTTLATAGYNAGLSRARGWRADRPLEGAIYVETIPFNETRDYVRKVMNNTMYYSRLVGQQFVGLKQRLGVIAPRPLDNE
jgi:soluble lytic murein transglycosylase